MATEQATPVALGKDAHAKEATTNLLRSHICKSIRQHDDCELIHESTLGSGQIKTHKVTPEFEN